MKISIQGFFVTKYVPVRTRGVNPGG